MPGAVGSTWLVFATVLAVLTPLRCGGCSARAEPPWCRRCDGVAARLAVVRGCDRCGGPRGAGHPCWADDAAVAATVVAFRYSGPVAAAVVAAKARGATSLWPPLGERLAASVADSDLGPPDAVVTVPVDDHRRRIRGIDHTRLLAGPVARRLARPLVPLLVARRGRLDQAQRGSDRRTVGADAFRARRRVGGAHLLLVDDVVTTGATAERAAQALRRAGADRIDLAVLARAGAHCLGVGGEVAAGLSPRDRAGGGVG